MKYRNRLHRLELRNPRFEAPPSMMVFIERPGRAGYELRQGETPVGLISESRMLELCAERPRNAPCPMVLRMGNSRAEIEARSTTLKQRGSG